MSHMFSILPIATNTLKCKCVGHGCNIHIHVNRCIQHAANPERNSHTKGGLGWVQNCESVHCFSVAESVYTRPSPTEPSRQDSKLLLICWVPDTFLCTTLESHNIGAGFPDTEVRCCCLTCSSCRHIPGSPPNKKCNQI